MIKISTIVVLGGGASGMIAAVAAAYASEGRINITICERMARLGRKILATGNGRCNFTNVNASPDHYFGADPYFIKAALGEFDVGSTLEFFRGLGVIPKEEGDGKVYPYSDQASAVLDALRFEIERLNINVRTGFDVKDIEVRKRGFRIVSYKNEAVCADRVVVACGGCASPNLGSNGSGFKLMEKLGHRISDLSPALVQIRLKADFLKALSGIKVKGKVGISVNGRISHEEEGEILFTDYGISGPPVFQLSAFVPGHKNAYIDIDFMPDYEINDVCKLLKQRAAKLKHLSMENFFNGLLNKRVGNVIAKCSGIGKLSLPVSELNDDFIGIIAQNIKSFKVKTDGLNGWNNAQVTAGGVLTRQFNENTMESERLRGLYCCGEIFDIHGECGGYNLQWAWSSGYTAGKYAAQSIAQSLSTIEDG